MVIATTIWDSLCRHIENRGTTVTEPILTSLYAAPLALMYIVLAARVVNLRTSERVSLGTGESEALLRATRIHGNFSEYVPFTLLLMALAEMGGAWPWLIHGLGLALIAGRLLHDGAAVALGHEVGNDQATQQVNPAQVLADDEVPRGAVPLLAGAPGVDRTHPAGHVHEDVDPPERLQRGVEHARELVVAPEVHDDRQRLSAAGHDAFGHGLRPFGDLVDDSDRSSGRGQPERGCFADSSASAGHDGNRAVQ